MKLRCRHGSFFLLSLVVSCASFPIPKGYLPDEKVVYLTQNTQFNPIAYKAVAADPYVFKVKDTPLNIDKPEVFQNGSWEKLLLADYQSDARLYQEVTGHFASLLTLPLFHQLRADLDSAVVTATPALPPDKGDKIKDYSNGGVYDYPAVAGAQITTLSGGYYEINFPDKSQFRFQTDGSYERTDAAGQILFASYPQQSQIVSSVNGVTYTAGPGYKALKGPAGALAFSETPEPQYILSASGSSTAPRDTFFLDDKKQVSSVSTQLANGVRFDYFPKETGEQRVGILITKGNEAIFVDSQFQKTHLTFDTVKRKTSGLLSVYLPEGIRLTNLTGPDLAYSEVKPMWPEGYKVKPLGPFDVLYTAKDEALVARLKADRVSSIEASDRRMTGLSARPRRVIVIPPDLESYRKLHASRPGEVLNWYPSGFETKDIIVMWPISVPRYDSPAGQDYFLEKEFYEILTHEYVHLLLGENTGIASPVPVWLNEGLAVYVESSFSPEVKAYWDVTFAVSRGLKRLLDWDLVTTTGTGELPVAQARVEYAQSYALVAALEQKFGAGKVAEYIRSFRVNPVDSSKVDLKSAYKIRFKAVFGVEFDQALKLLDPVAGNA